MLVFVEDLRELYGKIQAINGTPLEDIVWMEDGKEIEASDTILEDFKFTGLSNIDFILSGYYELEKK